MRWPWTRRRQTNDEAAKAAKADADERLRQAHDRTRQVDETARDARDLARRADRFAHEVERSMQLRRGAT
jgi:hypothetical protein